MQYPKITLAILLLPSALALPSTNNGHGHGHGHKREHKPYKSGDVSVAPFPSGTGGPFSLNNSTSSVAGTGTSAAAITFNTLYTTLHSTIYQTISASGPGGAPAESATAAPESEASGCAAPITITYNPTVTVTVTGNGGSPVESGVQSNPVASSSSAAVASASSAPAALGTSAPVVSSLSPVASSPAAAAETSQAPVSTQAASSAPIASSAPPVQSVSASPIGLSPQSVAASPSVVASSTTSAATGNTAAPASGGTAGSKRGIAFVAGTDEANHLTQYANAYAGKISWLGNFFCGPPTNLNPSIEFIPQMYGVDSVNDWAKFGAQQYAKGDKYMFSFGEPETVNARLHQDAPTAVSNWMNYMQQYSSNVSIGAPGVLQGSDDLTYLKAFLDGCSKQKPVPCKLGFVAIHWVYKADLSNVQGFQNAVNDAIDAAKAYNLPVWVDNFQAGGTSNEQIAFLKKVVPWLETTPEVQRYGYLPPAVGNKDGYATFLNADGSPSDLAKFYATM